VIRPLYLLAFLFGGISDKGHDKKSAFLQHTHRCLPGRPTDYCHDGMTQFIQFILQTHGAPEHVTLSAPDRLLAPDELYRKETVVFKSALGRHLSRVTSDVDLSQVPASIQNPIR